MNLSELVIETVRRADEARFLALMREHHYLGVPHKIGESAFYAAVYGRKKHMNHGPIQLLLKF